MWCVCVCVCVCVSMCVHHSVAVLPDVERVQSLQASAVAQLVEQYLSPSLCLAGPSERAGPSSSAQLLGRVPLQRCLCTVTRGGLRPHPLTSLCFFLSSSDALPRCLSLPL